MCFLFFYLIEKTSKYLSSILSAALSLLLRQVCLVCPAPQPAQLVLDQWTVLSRKTCFCSNGCGDALSP